jgi:hypothetical protein
LVAFSFGLFHCLGFAGAQSEIGVPQHELPRSFLLFNVGVEGGQIMFVTCVALFFALVRKLPLPQSGLTPKLLPYAIGIIAAFWTIERVASFLV